jgi:hypothetical protein
MPLEVRHVEHWAMIEMFVHMQPQARRALDGSALMPTPRLRSFQKYNAPNYRFPRVAAPQPSGREAASRLSGEPIDRLHSLKLQDAPLLLEVTHQVSRCLQIRVLEHVPADFTHSLRA